MKNKPRVGGERSPPCILPVGFSKGCWRVWGACAAVQTFLWTFGEPDCVAGLGNRLFLLGGVFALLASVSAPADSENLKTVPTTEGDETVESHTPKKEEAAPAVVVPHIPRSILRRPQSTGEATPARRGRQPQQASGRDQTPEPSERPAGTPEEAAREEGVVVSF